MTSQDPLIQRLQDQINALRADLTRLQNNSVRAEVAGAFARVNFADLPTPGIAGRVFWVLDTGGGALYCDNGTTWVPIGGNFRVVAVGDPGALANPGVTMTGITEVPTADPGWANSSTINMTPPNVYIKFFVDANAYSIPGWST